MATLDLTQLMQRLSAPALTDENGQVVDTNYASNMARLQGLYSQYQGMKQLGGLSNIGKYGDNTAEYTDPATGMTHPVQYYAEGTNPGEYSVLAGGGIGSGSTQGDSNTFASDGTNIPSSIMGLGQIGNGQNAFVTALGNTPAFKAPAPDETGGFGSQLMNSLVGNEGILKGPIGMAIGGQLLAGFNGAGGTPLDEGMMESGAGATDVGSLNTPYLNQAIDPSNLYLTASNGAIDPATGLPPVDSAGPMGYDVTDGANAQAWQSNSGFNPNSTVGDPLYGGQGGGVGAESGVGTGPYGNAGFGAGTIAPSSPWSKIMGALKEYAPAISAGTGLLGAMTGLTGAGVGLYSALKGPGSLSNGGVGNIKGDLSGANGLMTPGGAASMADPNLSYRPGYASALNNLIQNPASVMSTPDYQFQLGQGLQAIDRGAAAKGQLESGNRGIALNNFAQNYAGASYNDMVKTLAGISGANYSPATAAQEALSAQNQGVGVAQQGVNNTNNAYSALAQGIGGFGTALGALGTGIGRAGTAIQGLTPSAPVTSNSPGLSWDDLMAKLTAAPTGYSALPNTDQTLAGYG